ncbi:DNA methyltransferase [Vibrio phage 1254]|nr:hypothetical protein SIPHO018v1_100030 [Vibrio phage 11E33.1]QZI92823.1 hypothetical protein SIPHO016v1_p0044 [Vibrio phage 38E33.6a]QZI92949.1 hypothetical protein SIPHO015v1_p0011 [Vibrio phage 82E32.2]QZI93032.1 hypothetical protein SIPHO014v1_p0033 [Vibrio phage 82E32.3]QZI93079.1 hypothetical protein SIPHO013v1_p0018 [Vibrio phage 82E33.2]
MSNIDNLEYHPIPGLEQLPECDDNEKTGEPIDLYGIDACREHDESIRKEGHQRVNQNSGEVEWYTPPWLLERVKRILGDIDLDPASCSTANINVGAKQFFTKESDSLNREWNGVVWMNHPYGKGEKPCKKLKTTGEYRCNKNACKDRGYHIDHDVPGNTEWVAKFVNEFMIGNITKAGCITFASTSENWFRPLYNFHQVWLYDRVAFVDKGGNEGKQTTKGSVLTFMGVNKQDLEREFADIGKVK